MTGSARPLIAWAALLLTLLFVVLAVVAGRANGLLVLATVFAGVFVWALGAHRASWWVADEEASRRYDAIDAEIDFVDSVLSDIGSLSPSPMPSEDTASPSDRR